MNTSMTIRVPGVVAIGALAALAAALIWLAFPGSGTSGDVKASPLNRIAADSWNAGAYSAGFGFSKLFYDRILPVTKSKTLYITVTGTGRQENGDILRLACLFGGRYCDTYGDVAVGNTGANNWRNNSFTQTWCVTPGTDTHRVQLFLVAPNLTNTMYIEHVTVYVDGSDTPDACSTTGFQTP